MPLYEWPESMSVGVPQLDADHKAIIRLINRLHESLRTGSGAADLGEIFDKLIDYIESHFAREEQVMEACGYPGVKDHRAAHDGFAEDIRTVRDRWGGDANLTLALGLLVYLRVWLDHHVLLLDMDYRPYVEGNPKAYEAARDFGPGLGDDEQLEQSKSSRV